MKPLLGLTLSVVLLCECMPAGADEPLKPGQSFQDDVSYWHEAADRCGAKVRTLSEVKRTLRARRQRVDPTRLTPTGLRSRSDGVADDRGHR